MCVSHTWNRLNKSIGSATPTNGVADDRDKDKCLASFLPVVDSTGDPLVWSG